MIDCHRFVSRGALLLALLLVLTLSLSLFACKEDADDAVPPPDANGNTNVPPDHGEERVDDTDSGDAKDNDTEDGNTDSGNISDGDTGNDGTGSTIPKADKDPDGGNFGGLHPLP